MSNNLYMLPRSFYAFGESGNKSGACCLLLSVYLLVSWTRGICCGVLESFDDISISVTDLTRILLSSQ